LGKYLAHTGLDELPQLTNVVRGEMSLVGPRPFPLNETNKLTKAQKIRLLVKPGITSSWAIMGSHKLKFKTWMKLDGDYVRYAKLTTDIKILSKTAFSVLKQSVRQSVKLLNF
jgi:lipopolysaccharide/colanic/teichoic acid biosynthesis glycosyltransferase